jgi:hypothetical protein
MEGEVKPRIYIVQVAFKNGIRVTAKISGNERG